MGRGVYLTLPTNLSWISTIHGLRGICLVGDLLRIWSHGESLWIEPSFGEHFWNFFQVSRPSKSNKIIQNLCQFFKVISFGPISNLLGAENATSIWGIKGSLWRIWCFFELFLGEETQPIMQFVITGLCHRIQNLKGNAKLKAWTFSAAKWAKQLPLKTIV